MAALGVDLTVCPVAQAATRTLGHEIVGNGPEAVLVLHEWLGDHTIYDPVRPNLSLSRYTYVFADLRGYGLSRAMTGTYSLQEASSDAVALMDRLGYRQFHLVGHSMSGMVAQYLMAEIPDRLTSVVMASPVLANGFKTDDAGMTKLRLVITDDNAAFRAIEARTGNRYGRGWLDRKLAIARRAAPAAMDGYLTMFTHNDFTDRMAGLKTPVALITGVQDIPFYQRANVEPVMRAWFPNFQATEIQDAGHYSMLETPVLFAALVEQALGGKPLLQEQRKAGKTTPSAT